MQSVPDKTLALKSPLAIVEARRMRAQVVHVAAWLQGIWDDDDDELPAFKWDTLSALPAWALGVPSQLERLALLTGALFAAPALRLCLDAGPLMRVRNLIGAPAFDRVLAVSDRPMQSICWESDWPSNEREERNFLHTCGASLMAASVADPQLQASVVRALSLSPVMVHRGLPPVELGLQITQLANEINDSLLAAERGPADSPAFAA